MLFPEDYREASFFPNAASQNRSERSYRAKLNSICADDLLNTRANFCLKSSMFSQRRVLVAMVLPTGAPTKFKLHHRRKTTHRRGRSDHRENRVKSNRVHSDSPPAVSALTAANVF